MLQVRVKFCGSTKSLFLHPSTQCGNCRNLLSNFFDKKFVSETNIFPNELISRFFFFGESEFLVYMHCELVGNS